MYEATEAIETIYADDSLPGKSEIQRCIVLGKSAGNINLFKAIYLRQLRLFTRTSHCIGKSEIQRCVVLGKMREIYIHVKRFWGSYTYI